MSQGPQQQPMEHDGALPSPVHGTGESGKEGTQGAPLPGRSAAPEASGVQRPPMIWSNNGDPKEGNEGTDHGIHDGGVASGGDAGPSTEALLAMESTDVGVGGRSAAPARGRPVQGPRPGGGTAAHSSLTRRAGDFVSAQRSTADNNNPTGAGAPWGPGSAPGVAAPMALGAHMGGWLPPSAWYPMPPMAWQGVGEGQGAQPLPVAGPLLWGKAASGFAGALGTSTTTDLEDSAPGTADASGSNSHDSGEPEDPHASEAPVGAWEQPPSGGRPGRASRALGATGSVANKGKGPGQGGPPATEALPPLYNPYGLYYGMVPPAPGPVGLGGLEALYGYPSPWSPVGAALAWQYAAAAAAAAARPGPTDLAAVTSALLAAAPPPAPADQLSALPPPNPGVSTDPYSGPGTQPRHRPGPRTARQAVAVVPQHTVVAQGVGGGGSGGGGGGLGLDGAPVSHHAPAWAGPGWPQHAPVGLVAQGEHTPARRATLVGLVGQPQVGYGPSLGAAVSPLPRGPSGTPRSSQRAAHSGFTGGGDVGHVPTAALASGVGRQGRKRGPEGDHQHGVKVEEGAAVVGPRSQRPRPAAVTPASPAVADDDGSLDGSFSSEGSDSDQSAVSEPRGRRRQRVEQGPLEPALSLYPPPRGTLLPTTSTGGARSGGQPQGTPTLLGTLDGVPVGWQVGPGGSSAGPAAATAAAAQAVAPGAKASPTPARARGPLVCRIPGCPVTTPFKTRHALSRHRLVHTGDKRHPCTYAGCTKVYAHHPALAYHVAVCHTGERRFKCSFPGCAAAYPGKSALNVHVRNRHTGPRAVINQRAVGWPGAMPGTTADPGPLPVVPQSEPSPASSEARPGTGRAPGQAGRSRHTQPPA